MTGSTAAVVVGASVVSTGSGVVVAGVDVVVTGSRGSAIVVSVFPVVVVFDPDVEASVEGGATTGALGSLPSTGTVVLGSISVVVGSATAVSLDPPPTQEGSGAGLLGISVDELSGPGASAVDRSTLIDGPSVAWVWGGAGGAVVGVDVDLTSAGWVPVGADELGAGSSSTPSPTTSTAIGASVVVVDSVVGDSSDVLATVAEDPGLWSPTRISCWTSNA